ncbi:HNH endonuclease family protein [Leptothermofonsia sp. ETS-13]|uniref:HNH endonuclease family protein n=1 Tax=Leptothermofonsia sp. ETS-13 TaxID=3035696 RepID=UPI003B9EBC60
MGLLYEYASSPESNDLFSEHLNELHGYWSDIYREIGLQNIPGHEIIRFAATLKEESGAGRLLSAEDTLEFFKNDCIKLSGNDLIINKIIENTVWLQEITSCLSRLYADKRRNAVTDITQARLLAVAIMLRKDLTEEERDKLLEQWERTSFKIFGLFRKDARTKVGEYVRAARKIHKDKNANVDDLLNFISGIGSDFPIETAVEELNKHDFYSDWQKELRYFFFRYEEYLSKMNGTQLNQTLWNVIWESNPNETIEHILPQDKPQDKSDSSWNHIAETKYKELLHSIGNLCLLSPSLNSEASNKGFEAKKEIYKKANLMHLKEIVFNNDVERNVWDEDAINNRRERLIQFAINQWQDL